MTGHWLQPIRTADNQPQFVWLIVIDVTLSHIFHDLLMYMMPGSLKSWYVIHFPFFSRGFYFTFFHLVSILANLKWTHALLLTRARHHVLLEMARMFLKAFLDTRLYISTLFLYSNNSFSSASSDIVLAADELRYTAQAVRHVTKEIVAEYVLDTFFKGFCIGKWVYIGQCGGKRGVER